MTSSSRPVEVKLMHKVTMAPRWPHPPECLPSDSRPLVMPSDPSTECRPNNRVFSFPLKLAAETATYTTVHMQMQRQLKLQMQNEFTTAANSPVRLFILDRNNTNAQGTTLPICEGPVTIKTPVAPCGAPRCRIPTQARWKIVLAPLPWNSKRCKARANNKIEIEGESASKKQGQASLAKSEERTLAQAQKSCGLTQVSGSQPSEVKEAMLREDSSSSRNLYLKRVLEPGVLADGLNVPAPARIANKVVILTRTKKRKPPQDQLIAKATIPS